MRMRIYSDDELITLKRLTYTNITVSIYDAFLYYFFENNKLVGAKYSILNNKGSHIYHDDDELEKTIKTLKDNLSIIYGDYKESKTMKVDDVSQIEYPFTLLEDTLKNLNIKFYKWNYKNNDIYLRIYYDTEIDIFYGNTNFYNNFGSKIRDEIEEMEKNDNLKGL